MTYTPVNASNLEDLAELLSRDGFEALSDAVACLLNVAMQVERARFLGADPYERVDERRAYGGSMRRCP